MPSTQLVSFLGALALSLLGTSVSGEEPPSPAAPQTLLSTPLTLDQTAASAAFVGPVQVEASSAPAATPSEFSADPDAGSSVADQPTSDAAASNEPAANELAPVEAATTLPESRWAARTLPGSAREQVADSSVPVSGDGLRDALEVGGGLAVVLVLLLGLRWLVRRTSTGAGRGLAGGRAPSGVASILARYPIARGQQVLLLGVGQRIIVVHQSAGTMQTLSEFTDPDEVLALRMQINGTERSQADQGFTAKITQALEKKPDGPALEPVAGMPGLVSETVDLTQKRRVRLSGGGL